MGNKKWFFLVFVVAVVGFGYYFLIPDSSMPESAPVVQIPAPPPLPVPVAVPAEPVARYPIEVATESAEKLPLPSLEASDGLFSGALAKLFGQKVLAGYFYPDRMIHRIVATVDNLPRHEAPARMRPLKPVSGPFLVKQDAALRVIDPANAQRYIPYLDLLAASEARQIVDTYLQLYPLFQRAYHDLGYPKGFFNDRLVEMLDDLLAAPDISPPLALQQPKVLYEFADPGLETLSAGQKIILRMGSDNQARAKVLLRAIRSELLSRSPAR